MPRLTWAPASLADIHRLYRFLAANDSAAASRAIRTIRTSMKVVAHQPHIGRPVEDVGGELREWLIDFGNSGYVALYRVDASHVTVLAVRHQREVGY